MVALSLCSNGGWRRQDRGNPDASSRTKDVPRTVNQLFPYARGGPCRIYACEKNDNGGMRGSLGEDLQSVDIRNRRIAEPVTFSV